MTKKGIKLVITFSTLVLLGSGLSCLVLDAQQKVNTDSAAKTNKDKRKMYRKLTREEERVIVRKGTEAPFSG